MLCYAMLFYVDIFRPLPRLPSLLHTFPNCIHSSYNVNGINGSARSRNHALNVAAGIWGEDSRIT